MSDKNEKNKNLFAPVISCIVPIYNVEKYLNICIDSILNQTFKNFELILVDDGSPDNCGFICDEYAKKDSRIHVIHQKNAGVSAARNAGINIAKGEYICFVDSDDWIDPQMYEKMYNCAQSNNVDLVICGFNRITSSGHIDKRKIEYPISYLNTCEKIISYYCDAIYHLYDMILNSPCNKLYRRSLLNDISFNNKIRIGEDYIFNLKVFTNISSAYLLNECLYTYRFNILSAVNSSFQAKQIYDYEMMVKETLSFKTKHNIRLKFVEPFLLKNICSIVLVASVNNMFKNIIYYRSLISLKSIIRYSHNLKRFIILFLFYFKLDKLLKYLISRYIKYVK